MELIKKIKRKVKSVLQNMGFLVDKKAWLSPSKKEQEHYRKNIRLATSKDTLQSIENTIANQKKGAYLRFGDGDIYLMLGKDELLNKANVQLSKDLKRAMKSTIGTLHKGIPIHSEWYGYESGMQLGMHLVTNQEASKYLKATYKLLQTNTIYTPVALHYTAVFQPEICVSFLQFLKKQQPVFVGNENVAPNLVEKLFGAEHIKTPAVNSYQEFHRIEKELVQTLQNRNKGFDVVVVAMGCPGRALQQRILEQGFNVYLFDFGSLLDAFNNDNSRDWIAIGGGVEAMQEILKQIN